MDFVDIPREESISRVTADPQRELIQSEETYVSELQTLIETFVIPLESWISGLNLVGTKQYPEHFCLEEIVVDSNRDVIDELFSNIRVIWDCNKLLLASLKEAEGTKINGGVIAAFHRHAPYLKLYSQYTRNYNKAISLLAKLMTDCRFSAFIACAQSQKQCHGLNLSAFLILPVQRGPRYELLLKEMIKSCIDPDELSLLKSTLSTIVSVIKDIDSAVGGEEKSGKLLELQNAFRISLTDPARSFVRSGSLTKLCHSGKKVFFFVLCSDILFYGEEVSSSRLNIGSNCKQNTQTKRYKFHREFFLDELLLVLYPNSDAKSFIVRGLDKAFEIETSSPEECSEWVDDIIRMKSIKRLNVHTNAPILTKEHPMGRLFRLWQEGTGGNMVMRTYSLPQQGAVGGVIMICDLEAQHLQEGKGPCSNGSTKGYLSADKFADNRRSTSYVGSVAPLDAPRYSSNSSLSSTSLKTAPECNGYGEERSDEVETNGSTASRHRRHSTPHTGSAFPFHDLSEAAAFSHHAPLVHLSSQDTKYIDMFGNDVLTPEPSQPNVPNFMDA